VTEQTQAQLEAEIARARAELRTAVDHLSERLTVRNQAEYLVDEAKIALSEAVRTVTGAVRPADAPEPSRTGWIALGVGAAAVAAVLTRVARRR